MLIAHHKSATATAALITLFLLSAPSQATVTRFAFKGTIEGGMTDRPGDWDTGAHGTPVSGWVEIDTTSLNNSLVSASGGCAKRVGDVCLDTTATPAAPLVKNYVLNIGQRAFWSFGGSYNYYNESSVLGRISEDNMGYEEIYGSSYSFQESFSSDPSLWSSGALGSKRTREQQLIFGGYLMQISPGSNDYAFTASSLNFTQEMREYWRCTTAENCATTDFSPDGSYKGHFAATAILSELRAIPEPNAATLAFIGLGATALSRRRHIKNMKVRPN